MGANQAQAFETLREGLLKPDGCMLLTGDIGTGKTLLVKRLADLKGVAPIFTTVAGPEKNGLDFYRLLAAECRMRRRFDSREEFLAEFKLFLSRRFSADKRVVIVIDEAQRLNRGILQDVLVLSDLELSGRKLVKIFFVGQLAFNDLLTREENRDVRQRISSRHGLEPLAPEETCRYIAHRLKVAGREQPLFSDDAMQAIHALSKGYPRLINTLCDHALLYGYGANLALISGGVIQECSTDLSVALDLDDGAESPPSESTAALRADHPEPPSPPGPARDWGSLIYLTAAATMAALAVYLFSR
jgi:type II secretory pathway predicted ATPase ExeA